MTRLIFVVGATATGKSALALDLAAEFGGSILNCDSLQACRRLDIGSAKPTSAEQARVPHHLFDVIAPGERFTAGDFRRLALGALAKAEGPVFAVGGSGFYIRALEKGMFDAPAPTAEVERTVRETMEKEGLAAAFAELVQKDPVTAARLGPSDAYRIGRALMIQLQTGRTVSELRQNFQPVPLPYPTLKIGLRVPREELAQRIRRRTEVMLAAGWLEETRALIDEGFGDWPALGSVGYRECVRAIRGELSAEGLAAEVNQKTLALAKKQITWFKKDQTISWFDPATGGVGARAAVAAFIDGRERSS